MKRLLFFLVMLSIIVIPTENVHGQSDFLKRKTESMSEKEEKSDVFRGIEVKGQNGVYVVTGEARPKESFYYVVEDGHNELVNETEVKSSTKYPNWSNFELKINIPRGSLPENGTVSIYFYEKDSKTGEMVNVLPVILETFR
jgi:hypothetical protein